MSDTISEHAPSDQDGGTLDAYSQVVTRVAAELTLRVAALHMSGRRRDGRVEASAGSAVVFTDDGFLLTNAHVVGRNLTGTAAFADGTTSQFRVIGTDPLSDLAVVRSDGPTPPPAKLGNASNLRVIRSGHSPSIIFRSRSPNSKNCMATGSTRTIAPLSADSPSSARTKS